MSKYSKLKTNVKRQLQKERTTANKKQKSFAEYLSDMRRKKPTTRAEDLQNSYKEDLRSMRRKKATSQQPSSKAKDNIETSPAENAAPTTSTAQENTSSSGRALPKKLAKGAVGIGLVGAIGASLAKEDTQDTEQQEIPQNTRRQVNEQKQEQKQEQKPAEKAKVSRSGEIYYTGGNREKSKSKVLYSDANAGTDEYNSIKNSADYKRSRRDYDNRDDLTESQKEQRAVADVMAYNKRKKNA